MLFVVVHIPYARRRKLDDKTGPMILVGYHKTGAYKLFNPINHKIVIIRDVVINENSFWDWNSDTIDKPLMRCDFKEVSNDVEVEEIVDISVKVDVITNMPDTVEVKDGIASTSKRPQITRFHSTRLQDYEVTGDDEVTPYGESVHFSLHAGDEPINYSEALNNKKWKLVVVEELQEIERNNT